MSTQRFIETIQNINFGAVGATGLLPLDIRFAVVKEKMSVMLYARYFSKTETDKPNLTYSEFEHPDEIPSPKNPSRMAKLYYIARIGEKKYSLFLMPKPLWFVFHEEELISRTNNKKINNKPVYEFDPDPVLISIKPYDDAGLPEISIYDFMRKTNKYPDSDRIPELLNFLKIGGDAYSEFHLGDAFHPQKFPNPLPSGPNVDMEAFLKYQVALSDWYKASFPRRYYLRDMIPKPFSETPDFSKTEYKTESYSVDFPSPVFYGSLGPMAYDISEYHSLPQMRFQRLFLNPKGCGLREALIPTVCIHENDDENYIMTGLPNMKCLPLWNIERLMSPDTDTVVLCSCIQDADALQRDNRYIKNVAFTSYVDVGDNLELVDFSPLAEKNIIFLVSNHNGQTLEDAYEEVARVFEFIKKSKIKINDCIFIQREVQYPDSTLTIATPDALASTYNKTPPTVLPNAALCLDETEFFAFLTKIRKEREAPPFWAPEEQKPIKENPAKGILIRSLLYRNAITVLAGPPSAGKSRFCRSLIRYLVKGNERQYMKERFWTRCCKKSTMKILYWNFDCVPDLESWKETCLRGLKDEQKQNIFIEDAPTEEEFSDKFNEKPDVRAYRRKLEKYTFKGTPGHPLDLLIVDTLVSVWNKNNIEGSLRFLNRLMKAVPGMAVLAIHHTSELGKPLGGGDPKRMPRIVMTMERINKTVVVNSSSKQSVKKKKGEKKTLTSLYKFRYDKFSTSHADVEELPFYCVREDEDMYSVYKPVCTRDDMFSSLVYHYRNNDDTHPSNKVIGAMLGYCSREVPKMMIDEKKYFAILNKAKKAPPIEEEPPPNKKKQSKK